MVVEVAPDAGNVVEVEVEIDVGVVVEVGVVIEVEVSDRSSFALPVTAETLGLSSAPASVGRVAAASTVVVAISRIRVFTGLLQVVICRCPTRQASNVGRYRDLVGSSRAPKLPALGSVPMATA